MTDWFRKTSWTADDQADFWARHKRARPFGKAQYMRIQASHLAGTEKPELRKAALTLLNLLISEFPLQSELSCAYLQRASIHAAEGRKNEAISDYRSSIAQEREFPRAKTYSWLDLGWFAITHDYHDLYEEVLAVLIERESDTTFPVDFFRLNAIRSIIAFSRNDLRGSYQFASEALVHAEKMHSGFCYHPEIGLVSEKHSLIIDRLQKIHRG